MAAFPFGNLTLTIGAWSPGVAGYSGLIDELKIYKRALTDQEVKDAYTSLKHGPGGGVQKDNSSTTAGFSAAASFICTNLTDQQSIVQRPGGVRSQDRRHRGRHSSFVLRLRR